MGLAQLLQEPELSDEQVELKRMFFEATGYGSSDLLSLSFSSRTFLTKNGGKYRVDQDGSITHLAGPPADVEDRWDI